MYEDMARMGVLTLDDSTIPEHEKYLDSIKDLADRLGCASASVRVQLFKIELASGVMTPERYITEAEELIKHLYIDTRLLLFEFVPPDRASIYNSTFNKEVTSAFPSAVPDIREGNTCFALERWTACVFHMMRAAEIALRALASDRGVSFPDKPTDYKEWGVIIDALSSKVGNLRKAGAKLWPTYELKEQQISFYSDLVNHANGFNEVWRRHVSHARGQDGFSNETEAKRVRERVEAFMTSAARVLTETSVPTPEYWTSLPVGLTK